MKDFWKLWVLDEVPRCCCHHTNADCVRSLAGSGAAAASGCSRSGIVAIVAVDDGDEDGGDDEYDYEYEFEYEHEEYHEQ